MTKCSHFTPQTDADNMSFGRSTCQNASNHKMATSLRNSSAFDDIPSNFVGYPTSPKLSNLVDVQDVVGSLPISPHVNVPHSHNNFHVPPPLPPRIREKPTIDRAQRSVAQSQQAPDAPELPPRDISPPPVPPVPPRTFTKPFRESMELRELVLPTSAIWMRRNSALRESASSADMNITTASTCPTTSTTAMTTAAVSSAVQQRPATPSDGPDNGKRSAGAAPPINRKPRYLPTYSMQAMQILKSSWELFRSNSAGSSPCFSPGETTPKLPPKPKNTNFSSYNGKRSRLLMAIFCSCRTQNICLHSARSYRKLTRQFFRRSRYAFSISEYKP